MQVETSILTVLHLTLHTVIALVPTLMWLQVYFGHSRYEAAVAVSTDRTTNAPIEFAASPAYKMEVGLDTLKLSTKPSTTGDDDEDYTLPR